jgi:uroporphyrinogen decarboxylase
MNGYQRIKAALGGHKPDRVPIMLLNFMMAAREYGVSMKEYRNEPRIIAESMIRSVEKYQIDGICVDVDTVTLAGALGVTVDFPVDEPARSFGGCLDDLEQVDDLEPVDIGKDHRIQIWLEAVQLLVNHFRNEIFIRGNCDQAPFSLASMMRSPELWMMDLMEEENAPRIDKLLQYCAEATKQFLSLMAQTGCHMLSNGDSPAGPDLISPEMYQRFALPWEKQIATYANELGLPYVLHICGNTSHILEDMVSIGAEGLEVDYKTDIHLVHKFFENRTTFFGNLDPSGVLAFGTPQLVEQKTLELLTLFADTPRFVLNSGCAIPATAPAANIQAMVRVARNFRS